MKASKHASVSVFSSTMSFANNKVMRRYLVNTFGKNRWTLSVDIDEFWDYPGSKMVTLPRFLEYLTHNGHTSVVAQMIDVFPKRLNQNTNISQSIYMDLADIQSKNLSCMRGFRKNKNSDEIKFLYGGIRSRVFGLNGVWLTKMPLLFGDRNLKAHIHQHYSKNTTISDVSSVLVHYKFTKSFYKNVERALKDKTYSLGSSEYQAYVAFKHQMINFSGPGMQKYQGPDQLVKQEIIQVSNRYKDIYT